MKRNLDEINKGILDKIDSLDVGDNIKNFLKDALYEEYTNRDQNFELRKYHFSQITFSMLYAHLLLKRVFSFSFYSHTSCFMK